MSQPIWLGIGNPRPQPRVLKNSLFGHVSDVFDDKSITKIGEMSPQEKKMKAMKEAEKEKKDLECGEKENGDNSHSNSYLKTQNRIMNVSSGHSIKEQSGVLNDLNHVLNDASVNAVNEEDKGIIKNMSPLTLIKGGRVVNEDISIMADILLQDDKILEVSVDIEERENMVVVDATNKYILPGGIDLSTSFGSTPFQGIVQSVDDFQTGTKAALLGGTTLIVHNLEPAVEKSYTIAYDELMLELGADNVGVANGKEGVVNGEKGGENGQVGVANGDGGEAKGVYCDYVVRVGVTWWSREVADQLEVLVNEKGVTLFYIPQNIHHPDSTLILLCKELKKLGAVLVVYPSDSLNTKMISRDLEGEGITGPEGCYYSFTEEAELMSLHRYITIACQLRLPIYVAALTSKVVAQLVAKKRKEGHMVFAEVALAALVLDGTKILDADWVTAAHHVTHPPIRMHENNANFLLNQLAINDIQVLSSNHSAFTTPQKALGKDSFSLIPPGVAAVQERMEMLWSLAVSTGMMDASRFVACTSSLPSKILNLYPRKGRIAAGSDADLVIFDATKDHEYNQGNRISKIDFNVYEGMCVKGEVTSVIKDGRLVVKEGVVKESMVAGKLIHCTSTPDVAFSRISLMDESCLKTKGVSRDLYDGPISGQAVNTANQSPSYPAGQRSENFCRPPTRSGGMNMQDTTLSISVEGTYAEDALKCKKLGGYRVNQPPGGRTTQFW